MIVNRAFKQIMICAVVLILFCVACRFTVLDSYTVTIPLEVSGEKAPEPRRVSVEVEAPEVLRHGEAEIGDGYMKVPVDPGHSGESSIVVRNAQGEEIGNSFLKVGPLGTVYDYSTGGFTGDGAVLVAVPVFWFLVCAIMLWYFFRAKGCLFYSYATIYYAGFSLFSLICALVTLNASVRHILNPRDYPMLMAYSEIKSASWRFMYLTTPLVVAFAAAMVISNVALLRHEKPRIQNILGILISVFLIAGEALGWFLFTRDHSGSETMMRVIDVLQNTYATVFVYFECMLMGSIICGIKAAGYQPERDKDFIVILGCWFRKDGSLPPLLQGRTDRAIAFWAQQKQETGKEAVLIPSGGQGRNETMPEAEAIRRYLIAKGIPETVIRAENQALNTYQNMEYSGKIAREIDPEGKVVFSTTNYHVFRSGVWAGLAGLHAEGIGSRTKWWFWPNAFMRETVGLLRNRWKQEVLFLILLAAFFGILSMVL